MDKQQVVNELVAVLKDFQAKMGYDDVDAVTSQVRPHGGSKGFMSDITPTIARKVAKKLGNPIPDGTDIVNIFVSDDKRKKLTVEEAADRFLQRYGPKGATHERPRRAQANHRQPAQGGAEDGRAYAGAGCGPNGTSSPGDLGD
jgi:hypothetical protein